MKKKFLYILSAISLMISTGMGMVSCDDDPDKENYVTFTGKLVGSYLQSDEKYSEFAEIIERAGLMPRMLSYGHYTCFCPDNNAVDAYLAAKGLTLADLTDAQCDTIARTHIVNAVYTTFEMPSSGSLATPNLNKRRLDVKRQSDEQKNSIIVVNGNAHVAYATQNDTVENGIMQPIDSVIELSNETLDKVIMRNPRVSLYGKALQATGLLSKLSPINDPMYTSSEEFYDYITGSNIHESATPPDDKLYGFTAFLVPDDVLAKKGITTLEELYKLACTIYDDVYPGDVNAEGHSFEHLDNPVNPLYRFMAYHLLNRNVQAYNELTVKDDLGVYTEKMNPTDWYETFLPYTMLKVEHLTSERANDYVGPSTTNAWYLNRRFDDQEKIVGVQVYNTVEKEYSTPVNGLLFYIEDILKFDKQVFEHVQNCRIRMDFSTIFPELMSNNMRMNGDYRKDDDNSTSAYDHTAKYGNNYYFPNGYLKDVTVGGNGYFIYRRPRWGYWSLHGDEFICQGNYDITFRIPPVPFESEWQIRLGYAAMTIRGIAQIYFDNEPKGIPLDMTRTLAHESILGDNFKEYTSITDDDDKKEEQKNLKNKGFYRGTNGGYRTDGSTKQPFSNIANTLRIVLCTAHITPGEDHFLRVRAVSSKQGNNNEVMLDYLELVPKSVWGVDDEGLQEDDL